MMKAPEKHKHCLSPGSLDPDMWHLITSQKLLCLYIALKLQLVITDIFKSSTP